VLLHLGEREGDVELVPLLLQHPDERQVRHDEPGGRLREHALTDEPVHEAVVELEVRRDVHPAQARLREHLREVVVRLEARVPLREQERDVRVVRAGDAVAHEHAGIGVRQADALIVPDLALDRLRPEADEAARVR
jgi:hypothetical protein